MPGGAHGVVGVAGVVEAEVFADDRLQAAGCNGGVHIGKHFA